ncbi:glycosyltransferase [Formosa undariae]|uniref:Glycosyltransferase n=1 Tax=Formosa undariae TaxID=1325436 RepID=A0ABV5F075_9FLAO
MKVLQLIDTLEAGGAERMAVTLANALVLEVERSYLCATRGEGLLKASIDPDVGYLFLKRTKTFDLSAVKRLVSFVKREEITIIHAHASSFFIATLVKMKCPKVKLIWHDHNGNRKNIRGINTVVLKLCSILFSSVLCVNTEIENWLDNNIVTKQINVIPNFPNKTNSSEITVLKGVEGKRIICLANLRYPKNHSLLLEAFKMIAFEYPEWTLHFVGNIYNDRYSKDIIEYLIANNINEKVFLYGARPDITQILEHVDIGVLASEYEGLPLALLEYGLASLAVISTDVGDCPKVIINKSMGVLIPSGDRQALSDALKYFIINKKERDVSGENLKNHVNQYFSKRNALNQILIIYKQLVRTT